MDDTVAGSAWVKRFARRTLVLALGLTLLGLAAHFAIRIGCRIEPPPIADRAGERARVVKHPEPRVRTLGDSWVVSRPGLFEVHLSGDPETLGDAYARLLYPEMVENEGILLGRFTEQVPVALFRGLLLDLAQFRYRDLADGMAPERTRELAAAARAFSPDPFEHFFPTYQRFVYLHGLYDISLSFEHSPLIGCTSFAFSGGTSQDPGALLARSFDFEVDSIFDRKKAVYFVRETGKIPFASVAWPGLVGVVSGMNLEGLAVVVHGGRAGEWRTRGEPVVQALRGVLSEAKDVEEAKRALAKRPPLVSHILIFADRKGHTVRVERVPGSPDTWIPLANRAAETNHFRGPAAEDPKNQAVLAETSTLKRKQRADELVRSQSEPVSAQTAVRLLRDRRAEGGRELALRDRNAIDALIATHGVVFETARRRLWVSQGPHLLGAFVAFDLERSLAPDAAPEPDAQLPTIAPDPLLEKLAW